MDWGLQAYLCAAVAILLMGVAKGGLSALGTLALPVLSLAVPPGQAAGLMLPLLCVMDLAGLWAFRRHWRADLALAMLPGVATGTLVGAVLVGRLDPDAVRLLVGGVALWQAAVLARRALGGGERARATPGRLRTWAMAGLGGASSFLAHAGGPPVVALLAARRLGRMELAGTCTLVFAAMNAAKVVPYVLLGQLDGATLAGAARVAPLAPLGVALGAFLVRRLPERPFHALTVAGLALAGLKLLADGMAGLFPG